MDEMETSGSSSESENEDSELEARAEELERQLSDNKYLYDNHVELVKLYHQLGDLTSMRAAYERFHSVYPLTPEIWLTWLRVEMQLASSLTEKNNVLKLFEKAVDDYLSINLWLEYAQFSMGFMESNDVRAIINKGLTVGGLHASQGSLLWDVLREYEITHLSLVEIDTEERRTQLLRVHEVFRRQLSVPLLDMENTYKEWKFWIEQLPENHDLDIKQVEWAYQNALKKLDKYKPFEERLLQINKEEEIFDCFREYIKSCDDPSTSLCLYERAIEKLSLNTQLWNEYCYFCMKLGEISNNVVKRALRNCPWSEELWICNLRILENQQKDLSEITECFEQGLSSISPSPGLNLWLSYLEFVKRNSETTEHLHKLFSQAMQQIGHENDPSYILNRWEARIYATEKNFDSARKIWADILKNPNFRKSASSWLEFAALEKLSKDTQHLRSLYQRAISVPLDWPQYLVDDWMLFEREHGTLHDVIRCEKLCKESIKKHTMNNGVHENSEKPEKRKKAWKEDEEHNSKRLKSGKEEKKLFKPTKKLNPTDFDKEKSVFLSNMRYDITEEKLQEVFPNAIKVLIPKDRKGNSKCFAYIEFSSKDEVEAALQRDREPLDGRPLFVSRCRGHGEANSEKEKYSSSKEKNKLFVKGLPFSYTKKDLEELYNPHGATAVRLITRKDGKSKGIAYIEFPNEESAQKALKETDQMTLGDMKISVAISEPPPKSSYSEDMSMISGGASGFRNARTRLKVPLIPRVVQTKIPPSAPQVEGSTAPKSNEDFRKMLLNDK